MSIAGQNGPLNGPSDVFPSLPGLDVSVHAFPVFRTETQTVDSGKELRRIVWASPRWRFVLKLNALRQAGFNGYATDEIATLLSFIVAHGGNAYAFNFVSPLDGLTYVCRFDMSASGGSSGGTEEFDLERLVSGLWASQEISLLSVK